MYSMELHCMRQELYNLQNLQNLQSVQNPQNLQNLQKVQKPWNSNPSHWSCILQYSSGLRCITLGSSVFNTTPMPSTGVVFRCIPVELYPRCVIRGRGAGPTCRNLSLTPGRHKVINQMAQQAITARVSLVGARGGSPRPAHWQTHGCAHWGSPPRPAATPRSQDPAFARIRQNVYGRRCVQTKMSS